MVNSEVSRVERRDDDTTALTIQVVGFAKGKSVEISGYISQDSGAHASFQDTQKIPVAGVAELEVTLPPNKLTLTPKEDVRVLTWVSEVWPSVLIEDATNGKVKAAWKIKPGWRP